MTTWTGTYTTKTGRTITCTDLARQSYNHPELHEDEEVEVLAAAAAWSPAAAERVYQHAYVILTSNHGDNGIQVFLKFPDGEMSHLPRSAVRPTSRTRT